MRVFHSASFSDLARVPVPLFKALNSTRRTIIASYVQFADTPRARRVGLLKHERLEPEQGLYILGRSWIPFMAIHTFGMKFPIDVLFLDKNQRVLRLETIHPNRIVWVRGARGALELAQGAVATSRTQLGNKIEMSAPQISDQGGGEETEDSPISSII